MRSTAPVEGVPGRRVSLPQCVVGLAIQAANRAPLLNDGPHPVPSRLPLGRVGREVLGLDGQGLFADGLRRALFVAVGPFGPGRLRGSLVDLLESSCQGVDIAQYICR